MCMYIGNWYACVQSCVDVRGSASMYCMYCLHASPYYSCFVALSGDSDLFLSRLINEEIKVSVSQFRHKDVRRGM